MKEMTALVPDLSLPNPLKRTGTSNMADDNNEMCSLVSLLSQFENASDHPETYLKPSSSLEKENINMVKQIFDFCKKDEPNGSRSFASTCPLQKLLVDGFDVEQIWQEIELQNTPLLNLGKQDVQNVKQNAEKLSLLSARRGDFVKGDQLQGSENGIVREDTSGFVRHALGSESENERIEDESSHGENGDAPSDDDYNDDDDDESSNNVNNKKTNLASKDNKKQKPSTKKSQVDDTFFKLSDMLQFLDKEDRRFERANKKMNQNENDDDDDDDDKESDSELIDYFVDIDSDNVNEDDDEDDDWNKALGATESLLGRYIS